MASSPPSPSPSPSPEEHQRKEEQQPSADECILHKTKTIQFFGRSTPIVLQNDNGPCPLLAICNVLLLKNQLVLNPSISEVSQEKLLSLVAERLIDSNTNPNSKYAGYVENQQKNIADAIDLLPRLTTGIDVNIKFRRIDDFEFTPECAIFDLLDIPLYHGWLVDPQDHDTAEAIDSKSYNTILGDLVSLETWKMKNEGKAKVDEDCVDFAAATTATLGVPSPNLSRARSFDESPRSVPDQPMLRKGDAEEEAELLRALKLSENEVAANGDAKKDDSLASAAATLEVPSPNLSRAESPRSVTDQTIFRKGDAEEEAEFLRALKMSENEAAPKDGVKGDDSLASITSEGDVMMLSDNNVYVLKSTSENSLHVSEGYGCRGLSDVEPSVSDTGDVPSNTVRNSDKVISDSLSSKVKADSLILGEERHIDQVIAVTPGEGVLSNDLARSTFNTPILSEPSPSLSVVKDTLHDQEVECLSSPVTGLTDGLHKQNGEETSTLMPGHGDSESSSGRLQSIEAIDSFTSSLDGSEPIYEGEECILDSGKTACEDREPIYEGEVVLAEQADRETADMNDTSLKEKITIKEGELIGNFLKNNASQLTFYGLFCLQEGLKERELCVFFRNNHFNTMFKFEGELYLLATDQGYMNQTDLVWEKLNEVNGDTLFMTGNFKEFKLESSANGTWDEQNAVATTADYLASIDSSTQAVSNMNSDLQLAIALQQQEFEQQPQRQGPQQQSGTGSSRLITGPQVPRTNGRPTSSSVRQDQKSKDKSNCKIM